MADEQDRLRRLRALEAEQAAARAAAVYKPDPLDVRDPSTRRTPAQIAAQQALAEAVAAGRDLGIVTRTNVAKPGNVPTVTVVRTPQTTVKTGNGIVDKGGGGRTLVSTYTDPTTGDVIGVYSDGTTAVLSKGTKISDAATKAAADALAAQQAAQLAAEEKRRRGQSAFDLLLGEFDRYGLGALLNDVKEFIVQGLSRDELILKLRATSAYEKRFAANSQRIKQGLRALSEAEYINLEDQYQDVMRRYGLPESYYARGDMGVQPGFEKFIAGDVSPVELEDRLGIAYKRVKNAPIQVFKTLEDFFPEITNGDLLAYMLDPNNAIENIKRKVTAAEIGGAATMAGLGTARTRAEELQRFGVTAEQARQGFTTISEFLPQAQVLGERYAKQGMGPFTQETAEQEVFAIPGAAEAGRKRRKLAELEVAQFSGTSGAAGGALARERAGQY
jgi:hypothetical protein